MIPTNQLSESWLADEVAALTRLNQATARMWCATGLGEGLTEILLAAIELLGADKGAIQLFAESRRDLSVAVHYGFTELEFRAFDKNAIIDHAVCRLASRSRMRIVVQDINADGRCVELRALGEFADFRSLQATPMLGRDGAPLGVLVTYGCWPQQPSDEDLRRLDLYVNQATEFIQHCRTNRFMRENERRLQSFVDSAPTALAIFDRELRYLAASRRWMEEYRLQRINEWESLFDHFPDQDDTLQRLQKRCLGEETVSLQLVGHSSVHPPRRVVKWDCGPWYLPSGEIGGITISEEDITAFKEAERALKWRVECDRLLSETAARLLESNDPRGLVEELCNRIMRLFDFHLFLTFLADEQTGRLRLAVYSGISAEDASKIEWLNYAHTLCASVIRDRRPLVGGEILNSDDPRINLLEPWGVRAYCCHLLQVQGRILGTMSFGARDRDHFTPDEANVIKAVTDMMAIAMNRIQAEKDLRDSERQLQVFVENAPAAIAMFDQNMCYVAASRRWAKDHQLPDAIVGRSHYELVPQSTARWKEIHRRGLAGEQLSSSGESYIDPDGRLQWMKWEVLPWQNADGSLGGILVTSEDITEFKQVERSLKHLNDSLEKQVIERTRDLRNREERLQAILNAAVDAIITYDKYGRIHSVNPATADLFGHKADRLIGQIVQKLVVDPRQAVWIRQSTGVEPGKDGNVICWGRELFARRKDRSTFIAELSVSEIPELQLYIGIFRDVSQRKELQREVVEAASLEQRRIGQDLHDSVGQELTALNLLAQTLKDDPTGGASLIDRIVQGLKRCRDQMRLILRGLVPVPIDTLGLMSALSDLAEHARKDGQLNCLFDCPKPVALADNLAATHLYLIAQEAIHNAIKHSGAKNIRINLQSNATLTLRIEDDGCGFANSTAHSSSLGLGLRIMRNRAAIIGANLSIERNSPTGTVVECTLTRMYKGSA